MTDDTPALDIGSRIAERLGRDQVFGRPVERGDTTLVPVAIVRAGAGSGSGSGSDTGSGHGEGKGEGGGAGLGARPIGAFSLTADGEVHWHPAVDVNRIVLGGQLVLGAILSLALLLHHRRRR